jgi:hypothetical protein
MGKPKKNEILSTHMFSASTEALRLPFSYIGGLDRPIQRPFVSRDWRFGHYEMEGLQDPLSRLLRSIVSPISPKKKIHYIEDDDVPYSLSF